MPRRPKKKALDALFLAIGEVTVMWAFLELAVDMCVDTIHTSWDGDKIEPEKPRTQFGRKLDYLRRWYAADARNGRDFPRFDNIIALLTNANEHRQRLVHGVVINIPDFPGARMAEMMRRVHRGKKRHREHTHYPLATIRKLRNHLVGLATFMGAFAEILRGDTVLEDEPDKSLGALLVKIGGVFPTVKRPRNSRNKRR